MLKIGELNTKFCILSQDESFLPANNNNNNEINKTENVLPINNSFTQQTNNNVLVQNPKNVPLKLSNPTKIEPHRPPTDTNPPISNDSKPNTSRLKVSVNESIEAKGSGEVKIITCEKNTTTITVSKKNLSDNLDFFVEKRYCTKCNLEQPLRCKHCVFCNRCVGTYDHHCAWIGLYYINLFLIFFNIQVCII